MVERKAEQGANGRARRTAFLKANSEHYAVTEAKPAGFPRRHEAEMQHWRKRAVDRVAGLKDEAPHSRQ